jgi:hypothetical protein
VRPAHPQRMGGERPPDAARVLSGLEQHAASGCGSLPARPAARCWRGLPREEQENEGGSEA